MRASEDVGGEADQQQGSDREGEVWTLLEPVRSEREDDGCGAHEHERAQDLHFSAFEMMRPVVHGCAPDDDTARPVAEASGKGEDGVSTKRTHERPRRTAGLVRESLVFDWSMVGFWRSLIG